VIIIGFLVLSYNTSASDNEWKLSRKTCSGGCRIAWLLTMNTEVIESGTTAPLR
jgi:hypothetical protein